MSSLGALDPVLFGRGDPWTGGLPLDLYAQLRDEAPCYWQPLASEPLFVDGAWVITRYSDIAAILRDTRRFSNTSGTSVRRYDPMAPDRGGKPNMLAMDGAEHQRSRTVTSRLFSPRAVNGFADQFRAIAVRIMKSRWPSRAISSGLRSSVQKARNDDVFWSISGISACRSLQTEPSRISTVMPFRSFSRASARFVASWSVRIRAAR